MAFTTCFGAQRAGVVTAARGARREQVPASLCLADDFMLLLCASLQRQIFEDENKAAVRIMAGDNVEICMNLDAASFSQHNPVPDFIHCR